MQNTEDLVALESEIRRAFAPVQHPGRGNILESYDCCEAHAAWVEWCSQHTNEEFLTAIRQGGFCPFEFMSLALPAYHYFTAAVLLYCLTTLSNPLHDPLEWIEALIPLTENEKEFRSQYLVLFSTEQRSLAARILQLHAEAHLLREGTPSDSVSWAEKIWSSQN